MLEKLIVFVEEYSMRVALESLLPKMIGDIECQIIDFSCKDEMMKLLPQRLCGYKKWIPKTWAIVVLVDKDDDNCMALKQKLENYAQSAGFVTKTTANGNGFTVTNRIVIEELEAWYFGDWNAVKAAYPKVPATIPAKEPYRNPDAIKGGTWEALERIFQKAGYFTTGLRKAECARNIAMHMDVYNNRSHSFTMFRNAMQQLITNNIA